MFKKSACLTVCLLLLLVLTGCWSYYGLNEITIIAGAGVDFDPASSEYLLTCEVIDTSSSGKEGSAKSNIVESRGKTIFDAVRNARRRVNNKLYWGNAQVLVLGKQLAQQEKLNAVTDWFISDAECRETIEVIISQENSPKDILATKSAENAVTAYELLKIIDDDQTTTGSLQSVPLFHIFNNMRSPGLSVIIPAFHCTKNNDKPTVEANGEAVFKGEKLIGYLNTTESRYYLFATNEIQGGVLTLSSTDQKDADVSLEISKNKTNTSYSYTGGKLKFTIAIDTDVFLDEIHSNTDMLDEQKIKELEKKAQAALENGIASTIKKVQSEYNSDVFQFGNMIYKKDPKLWEQLGPQWDNLFPIIQVEVKSKVNIVNTTFLKQN